MLQFFISLLKFLEINKWKNAFNDIKAAQMKSIGQKFEVWIWKMVFKNNFFIPYKLLQYATNIYGKYMQM